MKMTIFDLDNCLADDRRRISKINWALPATGGRWDEYHNNSVYDAPHHKSLVASSVNPVFLTARPERVRVETKNWIRCHYGISNPLVLMRREGDCRPSVTLKAEMVAELYTEHDCDEIVAAYDDREDIVSMYYGVYEIPAQLLRIHDVCEYTPPPPEPSLDDKLRSFLSFHVADKRRAPDLLSEGAETFRERNAIYGDTYLAFGEVCAALFPEGLSIRAGDVDGFNRLGVFVQCISKVARYASSLPKGGHLDSAHDLMVYAAMLEEVTKS